MATKRRLSTSATGGCWQLAWIGTNPTGLQKINENSYLTTADSSGQNLQMSATHQPSHKTGT